jgi:hypothetical protein
VYSESPLSSGSEEAVAEAGDLFDFPGAGDVGFSGRGRLVQLTVQELEREEAWRRLFRTSSLLLRPNGGSFGELPGR